MKYTIVFLLTILTACADKSPTNAITDVTQQSIQDLTNEVNTLPKDCKPDIIVNRLNTINSQVQTIMLSCDSEKSVLKKDIWFWKFIAYALAGVLAFIIIRKITK